MAQLATKAPETEVDDAIAYLVAEWTSIPEVVTEWEGWAEHERLDFVVEWPLREDRLHQLRRWADEGRLTAPQKNRLDDLEQLIVRHRPALERLLAE